MPVVVTCLVVSIQWMHFQQAETINRHVYVYVYVYLVSSQMAILQILNSGGRRGHFEYMFTFLFH